MPAKNPTLEELAHIASVYHLDVSLDDLQSFRGLMASPLASYARLDHLVEPTPAVKYPRNAGYQPTPEDNPLGAWYWRTEIKGAPSGLLAGKTVAIKDNTCVAGVPMMNVPSALSSGLPVGMMLIGRKGDETTILRAADAFEKQIFSAPVPGQAAAAAKS